MTEQIEAVLDEYVRPLLRTHGGDMEVLSVDGGVVRFRLLGHCAGCPAADLTTEALIHTELTQRVPGVTRALLVQQVSEELLDQAKAILGRRHEG